MGIIQENMLHEKPEVVTTKYGAQYVEAATETPAAPASVENENVDGEQQAPAPAAATTEVKKVGRGRRITRKVK